MYPIPVIVILLSIPTAFAGGPLAPLDLDRDCNGILERFRESVVTRTQGPKGAAQTISDLEKERSFTDPSQRAQFRARLRGRLERDPHAFDDAQAMAAGRLNYPALFTALKAGYAQAFPATEAIVRGITPAAAGTVATLREEFSSSCKDATLRSRGYRVDRRGGEFFQIESGSRTILETRLDAADLKRLPPFIRNPLDVASRAAGDFTFEIPAVSDPRDEEVGLRSQLRAFLQNPDVASLEAAYRTTLHRSDAESDRPLLLFPSIRTCLHWDPHENVEAAVSTFAQDPKARAEYIALTRATSPAEMRNERDQLSAALAGRRRRLADLEAILPPGKSPTENAAREFETFLIDSVSFAPPSFYPLLDSPDPNVRVGICTAFRNLADRLERERWQKNALLCATALTAAASGGLAALPLSATPLIYAAAATEWMSIGTGIAYAGVFASGARRNYFQWTELNEDALLGLLADKTYRIRKSKIERELIVSSLGTLFAVSGFYSQGGGAIYRLANYLRLVRKYPDLAKLGVWKLAYVADEQVASRFDSLIAQFESERDLARVNETLVGALGLAFPKMPRSSAELTAFAKRTGNLVYQKLREGALNDLRAIAVSDVRKKLTGEIDERADLRLQVIGTLGGQVAKAIAAAASSDRRLTVLLDIEVDRASARKNGDLPSPAAKAAAPSGAP